MGNPRFVSPEAVIELIELWHLGRTACQPRPTSHTRMIWACREFHKEHPEVSESGAYKDLSDALRR